MSNGANEKTFHNWKCALYSNGRWIKREIVDNNAIRVWCGICSKHVELLQLQRGVCYWY